MKFTAYPEPRKTEGPFAIRVAAGRSEGQYDTIEDATTAAFERIAQFPTWDGSIAIVTFDGHWIQGFVTNGKEGDQ